jgi:hypothetical protein
LVAVGLADVIFGGVPIGAFVGLPEVGAEAAGDGIAAGDETGAGLVAGLTLALFAASPQAMPRAPKPRTVEIKSTFFICLQTPVFFLKD